MFKSSASRYLPCSEEIRLIIKESPAALLLIYIVLPLQYLCSRSRFHRQRGSGAGTPVHGGHSPAVVQRGDEGERENDEEEHRSNETLHKNCATAFYLCTLNRSEQRSC